MTRDLAEAAAYSLMNPDVDHGDIAHDWKVDEGELDGLLATLRDEFYGELEEALADAIEDTSK